MNTLAVSEELKKGFSIFCATCNHHYKAKEQRKTTCDLDCGSPLRGKEFPHYNGLITETSRWCFVCGDDARYGLKLKTGSKVFGLCEFHKPEEVLAWLKTRTPNHPNIEKALHGDFTKAKSRGKSLTELIDEDIE